jgi:uncharacterized protein
MDVSFTDSDSRDYTRLLRPPAGSVAVFGLRGAGKSSWARHTFPTAHVLDLRIESVCQDVLADSTDLARRLHALPPHQAVVVNDVHRVPALVVEVHRAMAASDRRFVLLGSNVRPLWTAAGLLTNRVAVQTMYPLVPAELGRDFALDRVLRFGSLPAVWDAADPWAALEAYMQSYVRDEIRGEGVVRNLSAFLRFLPAAALAHGRVVNVAALARDAATSRTTVDGYLRILRDTLMATLLPAFEPRLRVRERRHPKLYWTDPGVVRAAKRQLGTVAAEERGALLEGLVLTVLRAHNDRTEVFDDIGYWAPAQARATEVDFLLRRGRDYLAIEVRAAPRNAPHELGGLRAIANLPRLVRRVLVYLGDRRLRTDDGIDVWPLNDWLEAVASGRLWP